MQPPWRVCSNRVYVPVCWSWAWWTGMSQIVDFFPSEVFTNQGFLPIGILFYKLTKDSLPPWTTPKFWQIRRHAPLLFHHFCLFPFFILITLYVCCLLLHQLSSSLIFKKINLLIALLPCTALRCCVLFVFDSCSLLHGREAFVTPPVQNKGQGVGMPLGFYFVQNVSRLPFGLVCSFLSLWGEKSWKLSMLADSCSFFCCRQIFSVLV